MSTKRHERIFIRGQTKTTTWATPLGCTSLLFSQNIPIFAPDFENPNLVMKMTFFEPQEMSFFIKLNQLLYFFRRKTIIHRTVNRHAKRQLN